MKLPNWLRIIWWFLLVGFFAYLLYQRYEFIIRGTATGTDIVIFVILIALAAIPLFQEVSIFGVSFKKKIDSLRNDIEKQIFSLRSEIKNVIYLYPPTPPPDSELASIEERIRPIIGQTLKELGMEKPVPITEETRVPDVTQFLFSIRYAIENELRRIFNVRWESLVKEGYLSIPQMLRELYDLKKVEPQIHDAIREVNAICSAGIHGKEVSEKAVNFVRDVAPGLLASLRAVKTIGWIKEQNRG